MIPGVSQLLNIPQLAKRAPTFDEYAAKAKAKYAQATEEQIREAYEAKYGRTPVRSVGPSQDEFAARARSKYPDVTDQQIKEAYETKYGASAPTEYKRALVGQAVAPLVKGAGAILGGLNNALDFIPGTGAFDEVGQQLFDYGARVQEQNTPSADVGSRSMWNPYRLSTNVVGGIGQLGAAAMTGGGALAPLIATDAGSMAVDLESEGMDADKARLLATLYGFGATALERVGLERIMRRLPGRIKAGLVEGTTEVGQQKLQDVLSGRGLAGGWSDAVAGQGVPAAIAAALLVPGGRRRGKSTAADRFKEQAGLEDAVAEQPADVPRETPLLAQPRVGAWTVNAQGDAVPVFEGEAERMAEAARERAALGMGEAGRIQERMEGVKARRVVGPQGEYDGDLETDELRFKMPEADRQYEKRADPEQRRLLAKMARAASEFQPQYEQGLREIAQAVTGSANNVAITPIKSSGPRGWGRVFEKLVLEERGQAANIRDMVRGTILVENQQQAQAALEAIRERFGFAPGSSIRDTLITAKSVEDVQAADPYGYADVKVNIPGQDLGWGPAVYEIQITTPELMRLKNEQAHEFYEAGREREGKFRDKLESMVGRKGLNRAQAEKTLNLGIRLFRKFDPQMQEIFGKSREVYAPVLADFFSRSAAAASKASAEIRLPSERTAEGVESTNPPAGLDQTRAVMPSITAGSPATSKYSRDIAAPPLESVAEDSQGSNTISVPGTGRQFQVKPLIAELDALVASDDASYPQALQPRARGSRAGLAEQVRSIASRLDPNLLGVSRSTADGAPIVSNEGIVESGNGRVMALRLARDKHPERWAAYQSWLKDQGLDIAGFENPVLVQRRVTPMSQAELAAYTSEANARPNASLSATEQARVDARLVDEATLAAVASGDMSQAQNVDALQTFFQNLPANELNDLVDAKGRPNAQGQRRAEAALVAKAYGNAEGIDTLLERLYEVQDEGVRRITNGLRAAAYKFAGLRLGLDTGRVPPEYDIAQDIIQGYNQVREGREKGIAVQSLIQQGDLTASPHREAVLRLFVKEDGTDQTQDMIAAQLVYYAENAANQRADQGGLFGGLTPPAEILESARKLVGNPKPTRTNPANKFANYYALPGGPKPGGMQAWGVYQTIAPIRSRWRPGMAPRVHIVQSAGELPASVLAELGPDINGATDLNTGTVYLVADNIPDTWGAQRVLAHEAIGHYGFDRLYGDRFPKMVDDIIRLGNTDKLIRRIATGVRRDYPNVNRNVMAAEIIARLAEENPKHSFAQRTLSSFKELLRRMGFTINLSKNDLIYLLRRSADAMTNRHLSDNIERAGYAPVREQEPFVAARGAEKDLLAMHNLSESNLRYALENLGGNLAVPSLAITKARHAPNGFGEITLLGDADLIDPRGPNRTRVYGADIYSPRHPKVTRILKGSSIDKLNADLRSKWKDVLGPRQWVGADELNEPFGNRNPLLMAEFLVSEGHATKEEVREAIKGLSPEKAGSGRGITGALEIFMRGRVNDPVLDEWVKKLRQSLPGTDKFFAGYSASGDRRYRAATLENIVREMKRNLRGGEVEGNLYGAGQLRAHLAPQFRSRKAITKAKGQLVPEGRMQSIRDDFNARLARLTEKVSGEQYNSMALDFLGDVARIGMASAEENYRGLVTLDSGGRESVKRFMESLRQAPTEYFEAKILGPVPLEKFKAAVVPLDTTSDLVEELQKRGVKIYTYDLGDGKVGRQEAIDQATQNEGLLFASRPAADEYGRPLDEKGRPLDQQGRPIPEGQADMLGQAEAAPAAAPAAAPELELTAPEGQVRPPTQARLFASRAEQTNTPAFRRWFGDSKVVDESGKPLVVYHGTRDDITEFRADKIGARERGWFGPGFYFAQSPDDAAGYARSAPGPTGTAGANVMPVYLHMERPFVTDQAGGFSAAMIQKIVDDGYDGVIYRDPGGPIFEAVVFDAKQIKSAIGNRGTFDQNKPSILASRPGEATAGEIPLPARERAAAAAPGSPGPPGGPQGEVGDRVEVGGGNYSLNQFGRLSQAEQRILAGVMDSLEEPIEGQRRGSRTWTATEQAALRMLNSQYGLTLDSLVSRKAGTTANAEQLEAYGMLLVGMTREIEVLAKRMAATRNPSSEQLAKMAELREKLGVMLAPAMGYRTEAGRAMNILRKMAGDFKQADDVLSALGDGSEAVIKDFAAAVAQAGSVDQVLGTVRSSYNPTLWEKGYEVWVNGILSGPTTHAVNMTSNAIFQVLESAAELAAAPFSKDVHAAAGVARLAAIPHGVTMGLTHAKIAFLEERGVLTPEDKIEIAYRRAVPGQAGRVVRLPGRALQAEDEFFKAVAYQGHIAALAMERAIQNDPQNVREEFNRIMGNIIAHPDIIKDARKYAARVTFTTPLGPVMRSFSAALTKSKVGKLIVPFVRTPTNILYEATRYTPAAPLLADVRAALSNGGRDAALGWSRMAVGSSIMLGFAALAAQGMMSGAGPDDDATRAQLMRQGWRPYSLKMPDGSWLKYNRFEPFGMLTGLSADLFEIGSTMKAGDYSAVGSMLLTSLASNLGDKTFLRGVTDFAQAYADPKRYLERWATSMASSPVPNIVAQTTRWLDPYQREARNLIDAYKAKLPGMSTDLATRLDFAGEPIKRDTGIPGNPFAQSEPRQDPLANAMLELGVRKNAPGRLITVAGQSYQLEGETFTSYKQAIQQARYRLLTPLVNSPEFRSLMRTDPIRAQDLLEKHWEQIGREARLAWLYQNIGRLGKPKAAPGGRELATSYALN